MPLTLLTFHHFHSPAKLAALHTLTHTHPSTSGLYLQGRPGALLASSADAAVLRAYVTAVKRMRWQRVHTLGTEHVLRLRLPAGRLLPVGAMRELVAAAEEYGGAGVGAWVAGVVRGGVGGGLK
ncbi:hypothetical protein DFP73DRAFT_528023 [Morchella snyderi]|nr:hypothetical protein DFP73DRAFT_528023 [Morchella snyderi]